MPIRQKSGGNHPLAAAAERAGLHGVHPHILRPSCSFNLAGKEQELRVIQDHFGHRDPKHAVQHAHAAGKCLEGL